MALRCLIVDDNPSYLRAARELLSAEGLLVVGVATTGSEARDRAGELLPDLILIDLNLGSESGFDVARQLAGNGQSAGARVILISSQDEDDLAELIEASPAIGFIAKSELSAEAIETLVLQSPKNGQT